MSTEGYRVQKIEKMPEIITVEGESNVSPFPVRHWEEPLPIAVEGRELPKREESHEAKNVVSRFYPPLLLSSLLLTGVFLYLYVTKPVIVESSPALPVAQPTLEEAEQIVAIQSEPEPEIAPFPEENSLPGEEPIFSHAPLVVASVEEEVFEMEATSLLAEQMVQVESLNDELGEYTVSLPVLYPQGVSAWSEESIAEAGRLALEMEDHVEQVRSLQQNGLQLLEQWNALVEDSKPRAVLNASTN